MNLKGNITLRTVKRGALLGALSVGMLGTTFVPAAQAVVIPCGTTITTNTVLTADVGPCTGTGIAFGASGITLDLNGHKVFGVGDPEQGPGINVIVRTGNTVKNGEVTAFAAGIFLGGGGSHTVRSMSIHDNIGSPDGDFGDGITIQASHNNLITQNSIVHNGPYDGVGMFAGAPHDNRIIGNLIANNNTLGDHHGGPTPIMQDTGVRLENGSHHNTVQGNSVTGNGLDGIEIFANSPNNTVTGNSVVGNGFNDNPPAFRTGDGINAFPGANANTINGNSVRSNAANGIRILSQNNTLIGNVALLNGLGTGGNPAVAYDLNDTNAGCDANGWHLNIGLTFDEICVLAP